MIINQPVVHEPPKLLVGLCTLCTPPEPRLAACELVRVTRRLVQRTPDNRNTEFLHFLQVSRHLVDVLHHLLVLRRTRVRYLRCIKTGLTRLGSGTARAVHTVVRYHLPVPHATYYTTGVVPLRHRCHIAVIKPSRRIHIFRRMDIHEIEHVQRRIVPRPLIDVLCLARVPIYISYYTRDGILAVLRSQQRPERLNLCGRVLVT